MKSNMKRIAALVMAVVLVLSMVPGAMAAEYYSGSLSVGGRVKKPTPAPTEAPVEETPAPVLPEEPVVEEPTEEPAIEEPVVEPTEEPVVEPSEEPVIEEPAAEPTEEPVIEEPVTEEPAAEEVAEEATTGLEEVTEAAAPQIELTNATVDYLVDENGEQILDAFGKPIQVISFDPIENVTVSADANVRLEGDGLSEITQTIPADATVTVLAIEGDWVKVSIDGVIGYIYIDEIESMKNVTGLPEVEEEETEDDKEDPTKNFKVTIFTSRRSVMAPGETITLTSKIEGFENFETLLQWECDKGSGFEPISGAHGDSFSYEASKETLSYSWRLTVYYR